MKITSNTVQLANYGKTGSASVYKVHVKIDDADSRVLEMIRTISDKTWISALSPVKKASFEAAAKPTIESILSILREYKTGDKITAKIGQYLISDSASESLHVGHNHIKLPLSEIWKEQKSGNPGFDFHTINVVGQVIFGEAKYRSSTNDYQAALNQAGQFIKDNKHIMDARHIEELGHMESATNIINDSFGCAAAFSVSGRNIDLIMDNAIKSAYIDQLLNHKEVYVIGIEIC